jgi:hypothetical protein
MYKLIIDHISFFLREGDIEIQSTIMKNTNKIDGNFKS